MNCANIWKNKEIKKKKLSIPIKYENKLKNNNNKIYNLKKKIIY